MDKHNKKAKAFLFTWFFPYTHQGVSYDAYISNEVQQLSENFETVDVISLSTEHDGCLSVPPNVRVHNLQVVLNFFDKISSFKLIGNRIFVDELLNLKRVYNKGISVSVLKAIVSYWVKAEKYLEFLEPFLKEIDFRAYKTVVYCYWNFEYALAASLLKKKYPIKTVTRSHSLDLYFDRMAENYQPFRKFVYKHTDFPIFISEQGMDYFFKTHLTISKQKSKAFVNRIGCENTNSLYESSSNKLTILSNAWIQPLKRIELIVRSLELITDIDIEWLHVGDDCGSNQFSAFEKFTKRALAYKTNITYELAGRKSLEQLYEIYKAKKINLFINVSTTEGTPVSIMEALSFGVPVIATKVGGVPEMIEDGFNGFLLPVDIEPKELASKIKYYFSLMPEEKENLKKNARRVWEEKFNSEKNSMTLIQKITGH